MAEGDEGFAGLGDLSVKHSMGSWRQNGANSLPTFLMQE